MHIDSAICKQVISPSDIDPQDQLKFSEQVLDTNEGKGIVGKFCWRKVEEAEYAPTKEALGWCGIVYRGDNRSPPEIFKNGFSLKQKTIEEKDYISSLGEMKLKFVSQPMSNLDMQLSVLPETAICFSKNPFCAAGFPDNNESTFVYACVIVNGVQVYEKCKYLESESVFFKTSLTESIKEVIATYVPPEHIICAWHVGKSYLEKPFTRCDYIPTFSKVYQNDGIDSCICPSEVSRIIKQKFATKKVVTTFSEVLVQDA